VKLNFPDKETISEMLAGDNFPKLPLGEDPIELLDMIFQALKLAIEEYPLQEYKPLEDYIGYGNDAPYYHIDPEVLKRLNIPRVMLTSDEDDFPLLVLRIITKEGDWLGEAVCNIWGAAGYFAGRAFATVNELKAGGINFTNDDRRTFIIRKAANMLKSAFARINERLEATINSFLDEVFFDWAELWYEYHAEYNSLLGYKMKRLPIKKQLGKVLETHRNNVQAFWSDDSQKRLTELRKMQLVFEYKKTYEHWSEMQRLQTEGKKWRRYIKADDMADVTDDLVNDFITKDDISWLALEHAARRVELYNIFDVNDSNLEKRKQGIMVSGYSRSALFNFKREGEGLLRKERDKVQSNGMESGLD
jgi:hypothetical protein